MRFRIHSILFGAANAFLLLINFVTGMHFPWFLFPLGGWAILLAHHYTLGRQRKRQAREVNAIEELAGSETSALRKLHRNRTAFSLTLTTAASASLFLIMTNLLVSPHFPWAAITTGALGLVALCHYLGYSPRRRTLLERFAPSLSQPARALFRAPATSLAGSIQGAAPPVLEPPEVAAARGLKERIAQHLAELPGENPTLRGEVAPLLDRYLEQISVLARRRDEIRSLAHEADTEQIANERSRLSEKLELAASDSLKAEYRRALEQLDKQLDSIRRLSERLEIADLRIAAGINSLRQLEMDVVQMKSLSDFEESAVSRTLDQKSRELSQYLEDLARGRRELEDFA